MRCLALIGLLIFTCGLSQSVISQDKNENSSDKQGPSYVLDLSDADSHYVSVTMTAQPTGDETELMMAVWTPGSYMIREYAKHVDRIDAKNDDGPLKMVKTKKNRWIVETPDDKPFTVSYRIFCKEVSVRTNFVDNTHAVLTGAATIITIPEQMQWTHEIELQLPKAWTGSACSMRPVDDEENHYIAENYDEVVDSPIIAGLVDVYPFEVAGVPHYLVNVNDEGSWDGKKATEDLAKMVEAHHELWGCVPYDRYYFLNVLNDSGGGLEHDNCCLMMAGRRAFRSPGRYMSWLSLCSHEFFHTWNIRRLRPKTLVTYDYENEIYTPSLWVAEGVTSYYEDLLLVRAGILEPEGLMQIFSGTIRGVQGREGRKVQSLRDSSHDAWIKFYRPEENSRDTQVSYYRKGSVAAFLLDVEIRAATKNKKSLDDALRIMYEKYAETGYTPDEFRAICNQVAGKDLSDWFASSIDSTDDLQFQTVADWFGVRVGPVYPSDADQSSEPEQRPWIGVGEEDSPATEAGLKEDDEILAINGRRFTDDLDDNAVRRYDVGDKLELLVARGRRLIELTVTIGGKDIPVRWDMRPWDEASRRQYINRYNWFDAPPKPVQEVAEQAPQKIHKWTKRIRREPAKTLPLQ